MSLDFYEKIQPVRNFHQVAQAASYERVPDDWWVLITDVVNSTEAIQKGFYKEVNTAGAISLVALANAKLHRYVPVVFGGDGITLVSPPEFLNKLRDMFFGIRAFVKANFDLTLRIGLVSLEEIRAEQGDVLLGKFSTTNPFAQAIFAGDGLDRAEAKIKSGTMTYLLPESHQPILKPDFAGFSCPFRDIKSDKGVVLSLILKSRSNLASYEKLIAELLEQLGPEQDFYPISWTNLEMGKTPEQLRAWAIVAAGKTTGFKLAFFGIAFSILTRLLALTGKRLKNQAEQHMPHYTDHKKFDGTLKMVFSCSPEKRDQIRAWLEAEENAGAVFFGLHESASTLITCVFQGSSDEKEVHLIDGSNGGYALAAKSLKAKMKAT